MNKRELFKKSIAWTLIATMINPAMMTPAFARDSDIYLASTSGTSTAEPNVLFILGTNDRMNVAEAWREYDPLLYDSHAEYLWNDTNIIGTTEVLTENADKISDAAPPTNPFSAWGTWSGTLNTDRKALWQATLAYAQGTQGTDPGPRGIYRNYWDGSWFYWLPTGVATTDARLWSVSFNRFRGFAQTVAGVRGGVTFPPSTTANYSAANDFRSLNLCSSSLTQLQPSTIFAPTGQVTNSGYMLNQQWIRYEPWLNLGGINNPDVNYPGTQTNLSGYSKGYLDSSVPPTNTAASGPTNVYRDATNGNNISGGSATGQTGLPIRVQKDTSTLGTVNLPADSYGGWADPAADMGGYVFFTNTNNSGAYFYPQPVLTAVRTTAYGGGYSLRAFTGATALQQEQFSAWIGNSFASPAPTFGSKVGTPAYYDISGGLPNQPNTPTALNPVCNPTTGGAVTNTCINFGSSTQNATWTLNCTPGGTVHAEKDASDTIRYSGATCANNGAVTCTSDPMGYNCGAGAGGPLGSRAVALAPPALNCALTNTNTNYYTRFYGNNPCGWGGATTVTIGSCAWNNRSSVLIEGQGTYFYGGTCSENGGGSASTTSCVKGTGAIAPGTYNATLTLNGVSQTDVIGPFPSPAPANGTTQIGCANASGFSAGNYIYGGACTGANNVEWTVPTTVGVTTVAPGLATAPAAPASQRTTVNPAQCQITGGTNMTIRGNAQNYNRTCGSLGNVDQGCTTHYTGSGWATTCTNTGVVSPSGVCPANVTTTTTAFTSGASYYQAYVQQRQQTNLYHECIADQPGQNSGTYPTSVARSFGAAYNPNLTVGTLSPTTAFPTITGSAANATTTLNTPYTTNAAQAVTADASKNIDVYSVNYLNFLYGAKACRDSAGALITTGPLSTPPAGATCSPIARKTRLQVAKDALSGLVNTTDAVRLGLMVYNKTQGCNATDGTVGFTTGDITNGSTSLTVANGATFNATNAITILGAGPSGGNLSTTILSKVGSVYTLAAAASADVTGAQVLANGAGFPNANQITVIDPTQFTVGSLITVVGAGAAGANLATSVTAIAGNVYTLAANAQTGVSNGAVQATTCAGGNVNEGANVAFAVRRMGSGPADTPAYNNRAALVTAIQAVVASSRTPLTESLYEAYRYFSGRTPKWGLSNLPAGGGGTVSAQREATVGVNTDPPSVYGNVYVTNPAGKYNSPMLNNPQVSGTDNPANCQKNYIVMITNGQPEEDFSANADIKTMAYASPSGATLAPRTDFDTAGATPNNAGAPDFRQIPTVIGQPPYGPQDTAGTTVDGGYVWLDELAYFMSQADISPGAANFQSEYSNCANPSGNHVCTTPTTTDRITGRQSVITYTIGFAGVNAPVVQNAALASGGVYYVAQNAQQLQAALVAAFIAIRNWNPTAAAATVPISSLNRGESSHDVYLAFFGPSVASVWPGTVKKFQVSNLSSDCGPIPLCLTGQTLINGFYNIESLDPVTGQSVVDPTATSGPNDLQHPPGSAWYASTLQDGAQPSKGGTGHVLVNSVGFTPNQRKIYTFLTDSVPLFNTQSSSTDLTAATNSVDYVTGNSRVTRCRLGDAAACNGSPVMTFATKETLISYIRGGSLGDNNCTDGNAGTDCTTWGTWPHSSVEHSKPVIVNYDSSTNPPVQYMYYVQNNGMLTAVDTHTGLEKWSFLIEEALPKLQSLQSNANGPEIYLADGSPTIFYDDQNGDGIVNGTDRVWLYFGLRRGGRVYYALDITQKDRPFFKWKITAEQPSVTGNMTAGGNKITVGWSANFAVGQQVTVAGAGASGTDLTASITAINGGQTQITLGTNAGTTVNGANVTTVGTTLPAKVCNASSTCSTSSAYNELGQTWSTPAVVKLKTLFGAPNNPPALVFGGGYDPAEDTVPPGTRTMGRAVYVVNGDDATVVKAFGAGQSNTSADYRTANMISSYAIPTDITAINTDFDAQNYVDRLVFGDLGGNIWRIDVDDSSISNWKGTLLASLSNASGEKRKFFFAPAVVPQDTPYRFDAVYVGSGDKEHPLLTQNTVPPTTDDRMFMIMDDPSLNSGGGTPSSAGPSALTTPVTLNVGSLLVDISNAATTGAASLVGQQGWFRRLDTGEKVINAPTVFKLNSAISRLRFGTYAPLQQLNACTPPGEGRLNELDALNGDIVLTNSSTGAPSRWYTGFLSRGYMSSTQLLILPSGGAGSTKVIYQFNCADANCQGTQIGTLGAPTKIYWYLEPEQ